MLACAFPARAEREAPLAGAEDASLQTLDVGPGRLHVAMDLDVRNGDFVRGVYDDDAAALDRVPVHLQFGLVWEVARDRDGDAIRWLMVRSSNGFHRPSGDETSSPRGWYESNNLVGLATRITEDLTGGLIYAVKTSPNDVSGTTHELSAALKYSGDRLLARLRPDATVTWRPKGADGLYTQVSIEPTLPLSAADNALRLSFPVTVGVGWNGFYERGSGTRTFASGGIALERPLPAAIANVSVRAEVLALLRDDRLRRLGDTARDHGTVEPYITLSLSYAY